MQCDELRAMTDIEQFTLLWTQAQPIVASFIGSMVPDFNQAEDILQEVALVLVRKFDEYDPNQPFVAWALGIAKMKVLSYFRERASHTFLSADDSLAEAVASAHEQMAPELERRAGALRQCLKQIKLRTRELLALRYEACLPPREIAARTGMSAGAVRVTLARARAALQQCIEQRLATAKWEPES